MKASARVSAATYATATATHSNLNTFRTLFKIRRFYGECRAPSEIEEIECQEECLEEVTAVVLILRLIQQQFRENNDIPLTNIPDYTHPTNQTCSNKHLIHLTQR